MPILDNAHIMSEAQAVTVSAASTNSIDTGANSQDLGGGANQFIVVEVETAFADCTSIKASLQDSADDSSFTTIVDGVAVLVAAAIKGKKLAVFAVPPGHRRYLQVYYTIAGTAATAGKVNAYMTTTPQTA